MATTSITAFRRFAGIGFTLLFSICLCVTAAGQGTPVATASFASGLTHPTGWGAIAQTAVDANGDWLVEEGNGGLYEFPAGGGAMITLLASGSLGNGNNPIIAIDPGNNLYLGANWNNCIVMFPWDAGTSTWTNLNTVNSATGTAANPISTNTICTNSGKGNTANAWLQYGLSGSNYWGYFQPWAIAIGNNDDVIVGIQNSGNGIMTVPIASGAWNAPVASTTEIVDLISMTTRPVAVTQDPEGNIYFVEAQNVSGTAGLPGVYEIPAGTTGLAADTSSGIIRVDPMLPSVTAVTTDAGGNLYISDSKEGIFMVPNPSGTPQTSNAVMLTPVTGQGQVSIDPARGILYVPTTAAQSNGQADVAEVQFGVAELGSSPVGKATAPAATIGFGFNSAATPAQFLIQEDGVQNPDFAIAGGTCALGASYAAFTGCTETVTLTPHSVGSISGRLLMQVITPDPPGTPGSTANVTGFTYQQAVAASGSTPATPASLSFTAANSFAAGQLIVLSGSLPIDTLAPLFGTPLTVLGTGLSKTQFELALPTTPLCKPASGQTSCSGSESVTATAQYYQTVATMALHGTGVGPSIQATPAVESTIGSSLMTPSQIASDSMGDVYVADAGLKQVLEYAQGSGSSTKGVSVGSGLTAPTGVAVDGTGDVFIADSGNVYEMASVPSGVNELGGTPSQTLVSGLGSGLNLAADGLGNLYIADPTNKRVVRISNISASTPVFGQSETYLTAGFNTPSYVAVDTSNNLYVADGSNLFELPSLPGGVLGAPITLLTNLTSASGLAVDASGAVYISEAGGTQRIPSISGALAPAAETSIAVGVTNPLGVALDHAGNVYLADGTALNVHFVAATSATLTFPGVPPPASVEATIINNGNAPLTVTGYTSTNPVVDTVSITDWTAADGSCVGDSPLTAGGTCQVSITLNPGPGEQGALASVIGVTSNSVNGPITIGATGVGGALGGSGTKISVASTSEVVNTQITVTVAPSSGTGTPTGEVAVTYPSFQVLTCSLGKPQGCPASASGPTIIPTPVTTTGTLKNGSVTLTLAPVAAGSGTFTVEYIGDRTYGRSTSTVNAPIAKSNVTSVAAPSNGTTPPSYLPYVLEADGGTPYDGTEQEWEYNITLQVNTALGQPTGTVNFTDQYLATGLSTSTTTGPACPQQFGADVVQLNSSSQVIFSTTCLPQPQQPISYFPIISKHVITTAYSGDANYNGAAGPTQTFYSVWSPAVQICPASQPGQPTVQTCTYVSTQASPPALSIVSGQSATMNLALFQIMGYGFAGKGGKDNNYTFPVSLACDNLPPHAACSFNYPTPDANLPNAVDLPCQSGITAQQANEGYPYCTPGAATVTIYTNVAEGTTTTSQLARRAPIAFAAMFGFGMIGLFRRRVAQKGRLLLMICLMVLSGVFAGSLTACNTTTLSGPASALATPSGTYPVTITAQMVGSQVVVLNGTPLTIYGSQNQVSLPFTVNVTVQ